MNVVELPVKRLSKDRPERLAFCALEWVANRLEDMEDDPIGAIEDISRELPDLKRLLEQLVEAIKAEAVNPA